MTLPPFRPPLPSRAIPTLTNGKDNRAQAAENRRRIADYLELLREQHLPLPAAPQQPTILGIGRVAEEAGVSLGVLRPDHPLRQQIEQAIPELGLAIVADGSVAADQLSVDDCRTLFTALAPAKAADLGIKREAMQGFVAQLFDLVTTRAKGDGSAAALPLVRQLQRDAADDVLDISDHVRRILDDFDVWLSHPADPGGGLSGEALTSMAFPDLLLMTMDRAGLSQATVAAVCGVPQATVCKWLTQGRAPNARSYPGLRRLAQHVGYPDDALIGSITRLRGSHGLRLPLALYPPQHRDRRSRDLRASVKQHLTTDDLQLSTEALSRRIAALCAEHHAEREPARQRKSMRDRNRIDRSQFPARLRAELDLYRGWLAGNGRRPPTQAAYINHLEGFFSFAISENAPATLRVPPGGIGFAHVASRQLWEAYFRHLTAVGRETMGADFRISRAIVNRMKAVSALFDPDHGFMSANKGIFEDAARLGEQHLPGFLVDHPQVLMREIHREIGSFRIAWMKQSKRPTLGRDEIADLLSLPDPMIAVRQIVRHLRDQTSRIRNYNISRNGERSPRLNHHYATALRKLVMIHLFGQTALRIGMIPKLTVGSHPGAHLKWSDTNPTLTIPANLFKNDNSEVFKDGPYFRELENIDGFFADLRAYLDLARPRFLDGAESDLLFLGWSAKSGCVPTQSNILRNELTRITRSAIGLDAPPGKRLIRATHLRAHHFRDILATTVLLQSEGRDYALAGDAIHVTESTAYAHYARDSVEQRRPALMKIMRGMAEDSSR